MPASTARLRLAAAALAAAATATTAPVARAQALDLTVAADVLTGIEGGGEGLAEGVRRARTTVRAGVEGSIDERPKHVVAAAARVEIEPHASFGADLQYLHRFRDDVVIGGGVVAVIAPKHMIGATLGASYRLSLSEALALDVGPSANVFFMGRDLPDDRVIWQGLVHVGVRLGL